MSETMELAVVTPQNAVEIFTGGGLSRILDEIESKVRGISLDCSTSSGRDQIRAVAYKVARTKTALDAEAKKLTEGWRESTKKVNDERKVAQERLDALAEEVRAPLTAFENKEKNRIAGHETALAEWASFSPVSPHATAEELAFYLGKFGGLHADREWEEFGVRALKVRAEITSALMTALKTRKQFDADQAELARLRKEEADRVVRAREQRIKTEAAETARLEAERVAKEAADAEAKRVIEAAKAEQLRMQAETERIRAENERQRKAAEAKAKTEQDRLEAEARAIEGKRKSEENARIAAEKRAEEAKAARIEAERRAVEDLKAAKEKAKKDAESAVACERERVERERKSAEELRLKREADEAHRAEIGAEIIEDISVFGFRHAEIAAAIMDGKVRHVRVAY